MYPCEDGIEHIYAYYNGDGAVELYAYYYDYGGIGYAYCYAYSVEEKKKATNCPLRVTGYSEVAK